MEDRPPPLRLIYSDELGQLKVVQTADGAQLGTAAVAATWGQPDKLQCIDCVQLGSAGGAADTATAVLALARCSGAIELRSPLSGDLLGTIPPASSPAGNGSGQAADAGRVRGLHLLWGEGEAAGGLPAVLSVTQGGMARLHAPVPADGQQQQQEAQQQQQQQAAAWQERRAWQVPAEVCCTAYDPGSGRLAVGCQGAELRLFDVASGELAFAFKGGKPNMVGLVDRPWNTAVAFLPPASPSSSTEGSSSAPGSRLLVGTGHAKVRLYDAEAGKRPQMELTWGDARITCLALEPDGQRCWLGNGKGRIEVLDLRTQLFSGTIKGLAGSARGLAVHPELPVLASAGLDRYLRLHDRHTRQLLAKVYLKTLPTAVAFCPTDASMLPPPAKAAATEKRRGKERRRRRSEAAAADSGDKEGSEQADGGDEEEDSEGEQERRRQAERQRKKRGTQRGRSEGRRSRQRTAAQEDSD
ncbi:hypothetical protein ABPG77_009645 [Micractinium sp. CCAP 211/92]